ncbi:MAG: type I restriction endonuclease subunit R, partial [Lactococcus sp.]
SYNTENSLFKYLQIFVISNGTDTRYFANTTARDKNAFDFTMNWARVDNEPIKDLKDFTATFFNKNTLLKVLLDYSVLDSSDTLLIMRPYQIAATERILWKIKSSHESNSKSGTETGGYIWHTTGSGKTLTSFKAARLTTELEFVKKVFFVVDRKDLDYQTMKEYQRFSPNSVNGSDNIAGLKRNIEENDSRIIVTTIQKLNNFMKKEKDHPIYHEQVVFIFDECHRSQFGEAQKHLREKFKHYYQFGFTGTPIFPENSLTGKTTQDVFGRELHSYVITDAIRDQKVLKFLVDYNDVRPQFKAVEKESDDQKLKSADYKKALLHPSRITEISQYILNVFNQKTHRLAGKGFNAMFAVSSVEAAKAYYEKLQALQKDKEKPLRIATIFSFSVNEEQSAIGEIEDENFEPASMKDLSGKEFLSSVINDYNQLFGSSYSVDSKSFQDYYKDLAKKVKNKEIDLLIVVGMFLTGFDAPRLNTLFVDKNLQYHGLIQAFSRTNRIYDATKSFGNIVTFRNLEEQTKTAIKQFGKSSQRAEILLERSYEEYMNGFTDDTDETSKKNVRGYLEVVKELQEKFPEPDKITKEHDKKEFVKVFGEFLKLDNILQNYDDFTGLQALQLIDVNDVDALEKLKEKFYLDDEKINEFSELEVPSLRQVQDYRSTYNDIRDWYNNEYHNLNDAASTFDWGSVTFEVELLKSQEINLDYILELIFETNKKVDDKELLVEEITRTIRSSGNRAKETLIVAFIHETNLDEIKDKAQIVDQFMIFARKSRTKEVSQLIAEEGLNEASAKRYIKLSLQREYASENGSDLMDTLPKMSPLNPAYLKKKQVVFQKMSELVEKFKGVGGTID